VGSSTVRLPKFSINLNLVKPCAMQHVYRTPVIHFIHKHFYNAVSSYTLYMCVRPTGKFVKIVPVVLSRISFIILLKLYFRIILRINLYVQLLAKSGTYR